MFLQIWGNYSISSTPMACCWNLPLTGNTSTGFHWDLKNPRRTFQGGKWINLLPGKSFWRGIISMSIQPTYKMVPMQAIWAIAWIIRNGIETTYNWVWKPNRSTNFIELLLLEPIWLNMDTKNLAQCLTSRHLLQTLKLACQKVGNFQKCCWMTFAPQISPLLNLTFDSFGRRQFQSCVDWEWS